LSIWAWQKVQETLLEKRAKLKPLKVFPSARNTDSTVSVWLPMVTEERKRRSV
jgi:hypothetical protein